MKIFFKKLISLAYFAIAFVVFFYSVSCNQDKCKGTVCANGGICNDGNCTCAPGYVGKNCDSLSKLNFLGAWTVKEQGSATTYRSYTISIQSDTPSTGIIIVNFYNYFHPIRATIKGDTITIPNQQLQGKVVFGHGYICPTAIYGRYGAVVLEYEVIDTALTQSVDDYGIYPLIDNSSASGWTR